MAFRRNAALFVIAASAVLGVGVASAEVLEKSMTAAGAKVQ